MLIDSTNNNKWVSVTDSIGNAVAEIKANGNNLGVVSASMFTNNAAVREDGSKRLYLDRNITLTPQAQPATPVDIRLYIKSSEYIALRDAQNSDGNGPGIDSINDVAIYNAGGDCRAAFSKLINPVATSAQAWEGDYVLSASISSFTSFCFASEANCTAPVIKQLSACPSSLWPPNHKMKQIAIDYKVKSNCGPVTSWLTVKSNESITGTCRGDLSPDWLIVDNHHLLLRAERAGRGRGRIYTITVNSKDAYGNMATATTQVTVAHRRKSSARGVNDGVVSSEGYIDANGDYFDQVFDCSVTPNPSTRNFNLQVISASDEKIEIALFDMSGKLISKSVAFKNKTIRFGQQLRPGVYMVEVKQGAQHKIVRLVKQ